MTIKSTSTPNTYTNLNDWHAAEQAKWNPENHSAKNDKVRITYTSQRLGSEALFAASGDRVPPSKEVLDRRKAVQQQSTEQSLRLLVEWSSQTRHDRLPTESYNPPRAEAQPSHNPEGNEPSDKVELDDQARQRIREAGEASVRENLANLVASFDTKSPEATNETEPSPFRAHTFSEAESLPNPVPDVVYEKVVDTRGRIDLYSFVEPDESDRHITEADKETYADQMDSLRRMRAETVNGRNTLVPHKVFTQFDSPDFIRRTAAGEDLPVTDRIYLNPVQIDRVMVYHDFLSRSEAAGLAVRSKIYNYISNDKESTSNERLRQDGIVIYAAATERDEVLALVQELYKDHADVFAGRTNAPQLCEIADGLAVGSEPVRYSGRESLSSIRERILQDAYFHVLDDSSIDTRSIDKHQLTEEVQKEAERLFKFYGVRLDNWSFDTR